MRSEILKASVAAARAEMIEKNMIPGGSKKALARHRRMRAAELMGAVGAAAAAAGSAAVNPAITGFNHLSALTMRGAGVGDRSGARDHWSGKLARRAQQISAPAFASLDLAGSALRRRKAIRGLKARAKREG